MQIRSEFSCSHISDKLSTIARKAYACFGMKIYYQDLHRKSKEQEEAVNASFCETLNELLAVSDCVVLATPFGGSKLITNETLARFKKGSKFVNIARGSLVDESALVDALKSGHLSAVGLDVHENEPNVNKDLTRMRNVTYVFCPIDILRLIYFGLY
jgi:lactate dehydrogenase-like 2-hydroxyacid dehydrogenase